MALSEAVAMARLGAADVAAGLALSDAAGWNQTADDWAFFIAHGHAIGHRCNDDDDSDGRLVATAAALPYGDALGWISMVLVAPSHRHRGLATALLGECMQWLATSGRVAVLDATPDGEPVYRRLGFAAGFAFARWQGGGGGKTTATTTSSSAEAEADRAVIVALDAAAGSATRAALLRDFLSRPGSRAWLSPRRSGFVIARAGRRATQVGPLIAASEAEAIALLDTALDATPGRVFIDVPDRSAVITAALTQRGFTRQRPFVRMARGDGSALSLGDQAHALAGPEFG